MKFGIIGKSCTKKDKEAIQKVILALPKESMIITTGTKGGFESFVREKANENSIPVMSFVKYRPPDDAWPREFEQATTRRNKRIIAEADTIYTFSDDEETLALSELATISGVNVKKVSI